MSPPEVWGPAIWTLFHTLSEKINEDAYPYLINSMFLIIVKICKYLPCPECSIHASDFLARIKINDYKTKEQFKNMLYLFHNWVNVKKRKNLFNYELMNKYSHTNLINVVNNFVLKYNTKGNMKLLAESFQRSFVIKDFLSWFKVNSRAFITRKKQYPNNIVVDNITYNDINQINNDKSSSDTIITEETVVIHETRIVEETNIQTSVDEEDKVDNSDVIENVIGVTVEQVINENVL